MDMSILNPTTFDYINGILAFRRKQIIDLLPNSITVTYEDETIQEELTEEEKEQYVKDFIDELAPLSIKALQERNALTEVLPIHPMVAKELSKFSHLSTCCKMILQVAVEELFEEAYNRHIIKEAAKDYFEEELFLKVMFRTDRDESDYERDYA